MHVEPYRLLQAGGRTCDRTINPRPVLGLVAQTFAHWVSEDVIDLFFEFMTISQTVIEEVALPADAEDSRQVLFPLFDDLLGSGLSRERDDAVEVVWHQQDEKAEPDQVVVVMCGGFDNCVARPLAAELVDVARHAIDGDEEERAFLHPLRNLVWQPFPDWQVHFV
jgi:hypothetical protein